MKYIVICVRLDEEKKKELEIRLKEIKGFKCIIPGQLSAEIIFEEKEVGECLRLLKEMDIPVERVVNR
ncbi:hypothetical protein [Archaeoglobus veneficus]|uniref:Uncharacterized protein n=1 Tax=Archaeoglobus veneficus (strain DSM 11195 / SNP6) TaxID=693661 RepID=F2KMN2_ARCVS|nr:hypothetical protein [Archaeoglobus veneficus]AEA47229.1 hypothetical protein Arcve_1222 [Archaeoglobus veneficus SNP6]